MKKILTILFIIGVLLTIISCNSTKESSPPLVSSLGKDGNRHFQMETTKEIIDDVDLEDILRAIKDLSVCDFEYIILSDLLLPYDRIPSGSFAYIQSTYINDDGDEYFTVEARLITSKSSLGFIHYRLDTPNESEIIEIFENWYNGIVPELSKWQDVSAEFKP